MSWFTYETCIYRVPHVQVNCCGASKLACFDLDSTLILSSKGEKYATSATDWVFAYANTVEVLQHYHQAGFFIVIFSNRRGPVWTLDTARSRIDKIEAITQVPIFCFFATGRKQNDTYRKPEIGMMNLFTYITGVSEYDKESFYCGDAVGHKSGNRWFQWSSDDSNFANNCGLQFYEPTQIFQEFPPCTVPPGVNLVITCGQRGSGWELFEPYLGTIQPYNETQSLVFINDEYLRDLSLIPQPVAPMQGIYIVLGKHPTEHERTTIANILGMSYITYLYCRPSYDDLMYDANYPKLFNMPVKHIRCN